METTKYIIKDDYTPELYGSLDINFNKDDDFVLIVASPFIRPQRWCDDFTMIRHCKGIIGPGRVPNSHERSSLKEYADARCIPFMSKNLAQNILNHYVVINGCYFVNLSNDQSNPQLMLVYIPQNRQYLNFTNDNAIIGISVNTINLEYVESLRINGKRYGHPVMLDYDSTNAMCFDRITYYSDHLEYNSLAKQRNKKYEYGLCQ